MLLKLDSSSDYIVYCLSYLVTRAIIQPDELTTAPPLAPGCTAAVVSSITGTSSAELSCEVYRWGTGFFAFTTFATTPDEIVGNKSGKRVFQIMHKMGVSHDNAEKTAGTLIDHMHQEHHFTQK